MLDGIKLRPQSGSRHTVALDRRKIVEPLKDAGMPAMQAQVLVHELENLSLGDLVSSEHLTNELLKLKVDLLKWLIPILLGQVAVFAALVKWLVV